MHVASRTEGAGGGTEEHTTEVPWFSPSFKDQLKVVNWVCAHPHIKSLARSLGGALPSLVTTESNFSSNSSYNFLTYYVLYFSCTIVEIRNVNINNDDPLGSRY